MTLCVVLGCRKGILVLWVVIRVVILDLTCEVLKAMAALIVICGLVREMVRLIFMTATVSVVSVCCSSNGGSV